MSKEITSERINQITEAFGRILFQWRFPEVPASALTLAAIATYFNHDAPARRVLDTLVMIALRDPDKGEDENAMAYALSLASPAQQAAYRELGFPYESVRRAEMMRLPCSNCAALIFDHCLYCGACKSLHAVCDETHMPLPKYGSGPQPVWTDVIVFRETGPRWMPRGLPHDED